MNKETAIETTWDLKSFIGMPEEAYVPIMQRRPESEKMDIIFETVLSYFPSITKLEVTESTRLRHIVEVRRLIIFFAKEFTSLPLVGIAAYFKSKKEGEHLDHSTIIHSIDKVNELSETYKKYQLDVEMIRADIKKKI